MHGRSVPDLPTFTFSSGYTVALRRLSPRTMQTIDAAVRADHRPPAPPVAMVDYGAGPVAEPNPADPAYEAQLATYAATIAQLRAERLMLLLRDYGLVYTVDQATVDAYRAAMLAQGTPLDEDDRDVFLWHICAATPEDYRRLFASVASVNQPTEDGVRAHIDSFRPDVAGEAADAGAAATRSGELHADV